MWQRIINKQKSIGQTAIGVLRRDRSDLTTAYVARIECPTAVKL